MITLIAYLKRLFFKLLGKTPLDMPMVQYWKTKAAEYARVVKNDDGSLRMDIAGEDEPLRGFPRAHLLFGKLSKLKHEIKNQIFNQSWEMLENGASDEAVMQHIHRALPTIYKLAEGLQYDRVPPSSMSTPVRELHRAWIASNPESANLCDIVCFIFQEDDSYRLRFQWLTQYFWKWPNVVDGFETALKWLENAEVIDDMKERERLVRRIVMLWIRQNPERFRRFVKECDWSKIKMTKADKYHFRGKYFRVDLDKFEY